MDHIFCSVAMPICSQCRWPMSQSPWWRLTLQHHSHWQACGTTENLKSAVQPLSIQCEELQLAECLKESSGDMIINWMFLQNFWFLLKSFLACRLCFLPFSTFQSVFMCEAHLQYNTLTIFIHGTKKIIHTMNLFSKSFWLNQSVFYFSFSFTVICFDFMF